MIFLLIFLFDNEFLRVYFYFFFLASVRHVKTNADTPVNLIESWIARWLRYASDREIAARKKRRHSDIAVSEEVNVSNVVN